MSYKGIEDKLKELIALFGVGPVPLVDISDDATRQLGIVSGAVTTDALKSSDLKIDVTEKALAIYIIDALTRMLLNSNMNKITLDNQGRVLVKIDVAGTATPVTTASHAVTLATIANYPYTGQDHERMDAEIAFQGQRSRMEFSA